MQVWSACAVTFAAAFPVVSAAPFVPLNDVTPLEPSHKRRREDAASSAEWLEMLAEFEKI